jgi:hypothetical protein
MPWSAISKMSRNLITISQHKDLRVGTLHAILTDVADHLGVERDELVRALFGD